VATRNFLFILNPYVTRPYSEIDSASDRVYFSFVHNSRVSKTKENRLEPRENFQWSSFKIAQLYLKISDEYNLRTKIKLISIQFTLNTCKQTKRQLPCSCWLCPAAHIYTAHVKCSHLKSDQFISINKTTLIENVHSIQGLCHRELKPRRKLSAVLIFSPLTWTDNTVNLL
jgi:hypothetical protein